MLHLNRWELVASLLDLCCIVIGGFVYLQEPGSLRQRPQSLHNIVALKTFIPQPLFQVTDITPARGWSWLKYTEHFLAFRGT